MDHQAVSALALSTHISDEVRPFSGRPGVRPTERSSTELQVKTSLRVRPANRITLRTFATDALAQRQRQRRRSPFPLPGTQSSRDRGSEPDNDLVVDLPTVSSYHARGCLETAGRTMRRSRISGSSNGTAVGSPDRRAARAVVSPQDTIYLGSYPLSAARVFRGTGEPGRASCAWGPSRWWSAVTPDAVGSWIRPWFRVVTPG